MQVEGREIIDITFRVYKQDILCNVGRGEGYHIDITFRVYKQDILCNKKQLKRKKIFLVTNKFATHTCT